MQMPCIYTRLLLILLGYDALRQTMLRSMNGSVAGGLLHEALVAAGKHWNPSKADVAVNFRGPNLAPIKSGDGAHT